MYDVQNIAFEIKKKAKEKNITIKQLLENCQLNINTISELSKGKQISYLNFAKIADYLDCSVDYLLGRTDNPNITSETYKNVNEIQTIGKDEAQATVNQMTKPQDEMTTELLKAFQSMDFVDKIEIMNAVLEKTKMKGNE